jgi:hypothetical protein
MGGDPLTLPRFESGCARDVVRRRGRGTGNLEELSHLPRKNPATCFIDAEVLYAGEVYPRTRRRRRWEGRGGAGSSALLACVLHFLRGKSRGIGDGSGGHKKQAENVLANAFSDVAARQLRTFMCRLRVEGN